MMTLTWSIVWGFAKTYWKPLALAAAILLVLGWHQLQVNKAWHAGREALQQEQRAEAQRRDADANAADRTSRECAGDPTCLLRDDGYRRD